MRRKQRVLYADNGMVLTNGRDWGKIVVLAVDVSADDWWEITEAEAKDLETVSADEALHELMEVLA